jgi:adenosylcobinamide-phosphate synthase
VMVRPVELFGGLALDLALGDPRWLPHPVTGIGLLARAAERLWRATRLPLRVAGACAWLTVAVTASAVVYGTVVLLPAAWVQIYWIFSFLAVRSLDAHAAAVIAALRERNLAAGRAAVAMIVGRDTATLDEHEITRAVFETVAESLNDGIIAPLFWLALGGPVAMGAYKAINTLDSMFGYRNEGYREFGWTSARMDDAANWIPARLTAALVWGAALLLRLNVRNSVRVTLRDASRQPSPNSGYPEAAVAGALSVQLGGVNYYQGLRSEKPFLGDALRPLRWSLFRSLRGVLYGTTILFTLLVGGLAAWV